jgi:hypothetical protein
MPMLQHIRAVGMVIAGVLVAAPASAQVVQSFQFGAGFFSPRGLESRSAGDVLVRDYFGLPLPGNPNVTDTLVFDVKDFRTAHLFGEWDVAFGNHIEVGAGAGLLRRSVPSIYADLVDSAGSDIDQTLRLRVVPLTAVVRFLPFGGPGDVQPYVGAGVGALLFRYSEFGQFVDPDSLEVFPADYTVSGTAGAGLLLGGVRFPIGGDIYALSLEGRYMWGTGTLNDSFLDSKIDLGGGMFNMGFQVRF